MKKINKNTRPAKYYLNKQKGMSKKDAALQAGYSLNTAIGNVGKIESSLAYQEVEKALSYKEEILKKTTLSEIADEQLKVVYQDKDLGAKNKAIENVVKVVAPETADSDDEKVIIILKE
jgi:23S rRNA-/tRNA-specific pseudouridylate synthase